MAWNPVDVPITDKDREVLGRMLGLVQDGEAVATAGEIHPDIPTIHDIGKSGKIRTVGEVKHVGFGCFKAYMGEGLSDLTFLGGGALYHDGDHWAWCPIGGPAAEAGYDFAAAEAAIIEIQTNGFYVGREWDGEK